MISMLDIDFVIIGAAKSATTWLQRNLQNDPNVYMPNPELHFFSREYQRGEDWYLSQFDCNNPRRTLGEKSNSYLDEWRSAVRMASAMPHAKLIVQLRNPVERAYSDYCMLYRRAEVGRNIEYYLDPRQDRYGRFISGGNYYHHISRFLDLYPSEQMLLLISENISRNPYEHLREIRRFIGLSDIAVTPVSSRIKDKTTKVMPPYLKPILKPLKPFAAPFRNTAPFEMAASMLRTEMQYPELSTELRRRLEDHYAPGVEKLEKLIGHRITEWAPIRHAA